MKPSLALLLHNQTDQSFLAGLVDSRWPGDVIPCADLAELRQLGSERRFGLIYLELVAPPDDDLLEWIGSQPDPVVGVVNRKWEADQLSPYVENGLADFLYKPLQPAKIIDQVEAYSSLC